MFRCSDFRISIHAPTRGATMVGCCLHFNHIYFNPRSHERSDGVYPKVHECCIIISIHAPTRGATRKGFYIYMDNSISIHAPTRGATFAIAMYPVGIVFQSTLPREERLRLTNARAMSFLISIHAPTRGATHCPRHSSIVL